MKPTAPQSTPASLVEVLQARAGSSPDGLGFGFLVDGETEGPRLTYGELDRKARGIAAALRDGAGPGDRALLLYAPGLDFIPAFFGCLYAGLVAVPAYPPRFDRCAQDWQALRNVIADCQPRVGLTAGDLAPFVAGGSRPGDALHWIITDTLDPERARQWREPAIGSEGLALLQYTSGSTAAPKGVMVSHHNLMHNLRMLEAAWEASEVGVSWLPPYHDMGLVGGILLPLFHGTPCWLLSPLAVVQKPFRWLQAISRYRADISGGPNFIYDLCAQRVTAEQKAALDLSGWAIAGIGAEPVNVNTLDRFVATFASCGFRREAFYPCYGLAEATLFVTGGAKQAPPVVRAGPASAETASARTLVGCGRPWLDQKIAVVHPETLAPCPEGIVGEVWMAGPSVAQGYWNRPEETERTFRAFLPSTGEGPFLRTGDLGFMADGALFITGRIKDLIIIRGRNHSPQDIEETVQAVHRGLRPGHGAAFEVSREGNAALVVVQEVDRRCRSLDVPALVGDIRQAVAERHQVQVHDVLFLEYGSIPKTSSGKVQRHACRAGYERGTLRRWKGKEA